MDIFHSILDIRLKKIPGVRKANTLHFERMPLN